MSATYVLGLDDQLATLKVAGGKGASLARMAAAGMPVPGGFHVTTAAYRRFVDDNAIQPGILAALAGVDLASPDSLEAASTAIRGLFNRGAIPADIAAAVVSAYAEVGQGAAMGLSNSFTSLGRIVGPVWAGYTYDINGTYPFWSGLVAMLVGFVVSLVWVRPEQPQSEAAPGACPPVHGHSR
jgi:hypothetical protein